MTSTLIIAYSSPVDDQSEEEFLTWYREVHVPEVRAAIPAVKKAATYRVWQRESSTKPSRFVTVYEVDGADAATAAQALGAAAPTFTFTPAFDREKNTPQTQFVEFVQ